MSYRIAVVHKDDESGEDVVVQWGEKFESREDAEAKTSAAVSDLKQQYKGASARVEQLVIDRDEETGEAVSAEWTEVTD